MNQYMGYKTHKCTDCTNVPNYKPTECCTNYHTKLRHQPTESNCSQQKVSPHAHPILFLIKHQARWTGECTHMYCVIPTHESCLTTVYPYSDTQKPTTQKRNMFHEILTYIHITFDNFQCYIVNKILIWDLLIIVFHFHVYYTQFTIRKCKFLKFSLYIFGKTNTLCDFFFLHMGSNSGHKYFVPVNQTVHLWTEM